MTTLSESERAELAALTRSTARPLDLARLRALARDATTTSEDQVFCRDKLLELTGAPGQRLAAGRERARQEREADAQQHRDPFAGMTVVGGRVEP